MKKIQAIPVLIIMIILCFSFHAARGDGEVQYTKEMILGKWMNVQEWFYADTTNYKGDPTEVLIFNGDNTFEHRQIKINKATDKLILLRTTGYYKVQNNIIHLSDIKEEEPTGNMFPEKWRIVADEINVKLDILELEPDDCKCDKKRNVKFCRLLK